MQYRRLGRTGLDVGVIGLGTEYLLDRSRETMAAVLHQAVESGVNYVDVLYTHAAFLDDFAPALDGLRQQVLLAVHLGEGEQEGQPSPVLDREACERFFAQTLAHLHTDYADVILVQMLEFDESCEAWLQEMLEVARRLRQEGKGRFIGMSAHKAAVALRAVRSGALDLLMFPVNLAGDAIPGNRELYAACRDLGVGLVAMKPYAGGQLLLPRASGYVGWFQAGGEYVEMSKLAAITPVQCLSYTLSQPGACTAVPGVKDTAELAAALHYLEASDEEKDLGELVARFTSYTPGDCQYCNHCLPCPAGIDVGQLIRLTDQARLGMSDELRAAYAALPARASDCTFCGACTERCPFKVYVSDRIYEAMERFE